MHRWHTPLPLMLTIDQEGGRVQRLSSRTGFTDYPSAASLGRGTVAATHQVCSQMAAELAELGFEMNFAPVVDLAANPQSPVVAMLERSMAPKLRW